jgi:hypothetical protein
MLPHLARDPIALWRAHLGEGEGEIVERALVARQPMRHDAPTPGGESGTYVQWQSGKYRGDDPENEIFDPLARATNPGGQFNNPSTILFARVMEAGRWGSQEPADFRVARRQGRM